MNIGVDIRCLMERERSGVGEYTFQFLDELFRDIAEKRGSFTRTLFGVQDEQELVFYLFWNSWHNILANLPLWNYPFIHYYGFHFPNKLFNFSLKFFKFPKFDKLIKRNIKPFTPLEAERSVVCREDECSRLLVSAERNVSTELLTGFTYSHELETRKRTAGIDRFIFPNQNFYALSRGVKKTVIVHDLSPELYPECFSLKQRLWHRFVNLRKMVVDAEKIIAVSENTKLDLINLYKINPTKIIVLHPKIVLLRYVGVLEGEEQVKPQTLEAFTYSHELENSSGEQARGNYILFLGTIEPRKNVLGLLKAYESLVVAQLRRVAELRQAVPELWIAGKAGYKSKEVFDYCKKMPARHKVKFLGYVSEKEKWKLYRGARTFVYPSLYEGFGLPVAEAMSVGTPVITSLTSSMHEVVKENGLLIDPNRVEDLVIAMRDCVVARNEATK